MYSSSSILENPVYMAGEELELSERNEYSRLTTHGKHLSNRSSTVTPYYIAAYNEQMNVPNLQEHGINYQQYITEGLKQQNASYQPMTQYKSEELKLQNDILRNIMANKNRGFIDGAWALITYGEFNRPVTDIYVTENNYVIDNSNNVQDQFRIGLRSLRQCRAEILFNGNLHVILSQSKSGSISLINNSNFPVFIKDYLDMKQPYFSQEVIEQQGVIFNQSEPTKIFDIEEFRSEMALQIYHSRFSREQFMLFCKTNVLFTNAQHFMESPSWIMVTNLQALDLIFDDQEYYSLQEQIANFVAAGTLRKMKNKKKSFKERTFSNQKELDPKRKTRMSLAMQGYKIKDFMRYSWEKEGVVPPEDAININEMGEFFEPEKDYMIDFETDNAGHKHAKLVGEKLWAKVKYTLENMNNEDV